MFRRMGIKRVIVGLFFKKKNSLHFLIYFSKDIEVPIDDVLNPLPRTKNHSKGQLLSVFYDPLRTIHPLPRSLVVCVLALVEVLFVKPPLVPSTLLFANAKMEVYHPLYGVLYEVRRIRMLLLQVAVLFVRRDCRTEEEGCHLRG